MAQKMGLTFQYVSQGCPKWLSLLWFSDIDAVPQWAIRLDPYKQCASHLHQLLDSGYRQENTVHPWKKVS